MCMCVTIKCPDSATKKDLVAYLERISLYCHQLNITSKVKADVQNISGELIVSGVSERYTTFMMAFWFLCRHTVYNHQVNRQSLHFTVLLD